MTEDELEMTGGALEEVEDELDEEDLLEVDVVDEDDVDEELDEENFEVVL